MSRTIKSIEADLTRCREDRDALAQELETVVGTGKADRLGAYRRSCEACRRLSDELSGAYGRFDR